MYRIKHLKIKNHLFAGLLILFQLPVFYAGAQLKTVRITDFGAIPNDKISDQEAFSRATVFINQSKIPVRLLIKAGKYLVGPSPKAPVTTGTVNDVFLFKNCKNVFIEGLGKVLLRFADSLSFGTKAGVPAGKDSAVHVGSLFRLINCSNIHIKNLEADGNSSSFRLLKAWGEGTRPYEREHEGLFILNSSNITVTDAVFRNFGRDGALILQDPGMPPVSNIQFKNCSFNNNGRNGFSWCGGEDVLFVNCRFNENGRGRINTNPAAGLDIEPEREAKCTKGVFRKCIFSANSGYAITSGYSMADHVLFDDCTIEGTNNYALLCNSPFYSFQNCRIGGTSLFVFDASEESMGTRVQKCVLSDSIPGKKYFILNYLAGITGRYLRFNDCVFNGFTSPLLYTEIKKKSKADSPENTSFEQCVFNVYFKKPGTWGKNAMMVSNSNFVNCTFNSRGIADFRMLEDHEKNLKSENSIIKKTDN